MSCIKNKQASLRMKKKCKILLFISLICLSFLFLCSCQSTNEKDCYFNYTKIEQATFEYDSIENETKVAFEAKVTNNTIYRLRNWSVKFKLYHDNSFLREETIYYEKEIANGAAYTGWFSFYVENEVDKIEYISWNIELDSFWDTYKVWIIVTGIVFLIAMILYILAVIFMGLELEDTLWGIEEFCSEHSWIAICLLIPFGGAIWGIVSSNWVPVVIIASAMVAFVVLGLIVHLIKYVIGMSVYGCFGVCSVGGCSEWCSLPSRKEKSKRKKEKDDTQEEYFDNQIEKVSDYVKSPEKLERFTVQQLKEYCQTNNLTGYSKLNKSELISFIIFNDVQTVDTKKCAQGQGENKRKNAIEQLDELIGLESVKTQIKRIRAILMKNKDSSEPMNLHMCFYGNPGTGKTVVARLMAKIFYEVGVLPSDKLIETDRSGLCGQYVGETAPLTHKKVKAAMGGVLFIDEAYTLYADSNTEDYGREVIAALLKDMEDYKGKFCVILAGYKDEMEQMIAMNPGFDSRINRKINFPDYTIEELMQIFNAMLSKKKYEITDDACEKVKEVLLRLSKNKKFANARTVRNVLDSLIEIQAVRTLEDDDLENDNERVIRFIDVEQYDNEN